MLHMIILWVKEMEKNILSSHPKVILLELNWPWLPKNMTLKKKVRSC